MMLQEDNYPVMTYIIPQGNHNMNIYGKEIPFVMTYIIPQGNHNMLGVFQQVTQSYDLYHSARESQLK